MSEASYPWLAARTRQFTLGRPRQFAVAGGRVVFLRSESGTDSAAALWVLDQHGVENLVADPRVLLGEAAEVLTDEERARRERSRETGTGLVAFALDDACRLATFALSGRLFLADLATLTVRELPAKTPVLDPRLDPSGQRVAYLAAGELRVIELDGHDRAVAAEEGVAWGAAEFVAAEEMGRHRGYWWAPDGLRLLAARVDEAPVQRWWISDPANPDRPPRQVAYPAAGTANADVRLAVVDLDRSRRFVEWDRDALPYVITAGWRERGPWVQVMSRDQCRAQLLEVDAKLGTTTVEVTSQDRIWLEVIPGVPAWTADGRLVSTVDDGDTRRLTLDAVPVTPPGLQVLRVVHAHRTVVFTATEEPTERHVYRLDTTDGSLTRLTNEPGVHEASADDETTVIVSATLRETVATTTVRRGGFESASIVSVAALPPVEPRVRLLRCGPRQLRTAVVLPRDTCRPAGALPVLLDPYGGPHAQRVLARADAYLTPQFFADQGFAVVICDGRGTPARGPQWERSIHTDLAGPVLEDQIAALHAVDEALPGELDLARVGIRGWSFGGYLAALAVLVRPDVFHAAIAGAPVTDLALYDTFYTERYLGLPQSQPEAYRRSSLLALAEQLQRPLLLIHGLADDNVVVAHSLRLSAALLSAGRAHSVLPLSGVTHMTPQESVAANLLVLQARFLLDCLVRTTPPPGPR